MWEGRTPAEARIALAKPDVTVTNQKDKETQLAKLQTLEDEVKEACAVGTSEQQRRRSQNLATPPTRRPSQSLLSWRSSGRFNQDEDQASGTRQVGSGWSLLSSKLTRIASKSSVTQASAQAHANALLDLEMMGADATGRVSQEEQRNSGGQHLSGVRHHGSTHDLPAMPDRSKLNAARPLGPTTRRIVVSSPPPRDSFNRPRQSAEFGDEDIELRAEESPPRRASHLSIMNNKIRSVEDRTTRHTAVHRRTTIAGVIDRSRLSAYEADGKADSESKERPGRLTARTLPRTSSHPRQCAECVDERRCMGGDSMAGEMGTRANVATNKLPLPAQESRAARGDPQEMLSAARLPPPDASVERHSSHTGQRPSRRSRSIKI